MIEIVDKKKRIIKLKRPDYNDLVCQRERYKSELLTKDDSMSSESVIGFYVESLEASEWLIVDPNCDNKYSDTKKCFCRISNLLEVIEFVSKKDRDLLVKGHLTSMSEVGLHIQSFQGSKGLGDVISNLCTECLFDEEGHEIKLLDLLAVKTQEYNEFLNFYNLEVKTEEK